MPGRSDMTGFMWVRLRGGAGGIHVSVRCLPKAVRPLTVRPPPDAATPFLFELQLTHRQRQSGALPVSRRFLRGTLMHASFSLPFFERRERRRKGRGVARQRFATGPAKEGLQQHLLVMHGELRCNFIKNLKHMRIHPKTSAWP
ncbi:unnamed protein product [Ectocarpus sp. 4 AP-2014]